MTLAIENCDGLLEPTVFSGLTTLTKELQPAGRSFHESYEKPILSQRTTKKTNAKELPSSSESELEETTSKKKGKKITSSFKLDKVVEGCDLYDLLDVPQDCTFDTLKQSYRRKVLEHHPDKIKESERKNADAKFIRIQAAFEILSDPEKRRQYDSSLPFEEFVPTSLERGEDFFEVFTPAFEMNARWSARRPVPKLGDLNTPYDSIEKFYDFWFSFQNTRDFAHHDEHDTNQSTCREEKRWMERQNSKTRTRLQNAENGRIIRLVEAAQKLDPRVQSRKAQEAASALESKKAAKERKQREEQEAKESAERAKREVLEAEELRKQKIAQEKADIKKCRPLIRGCIRSGFESKELDETVVGSFLLTLTSLPEIEGLVKDLQGSEDPVRFFREFYAKKTNTTFTPSTTVSDAKKKEKCSSTDNWAASELALFQKGLTKFPVGVPKRWEEISVFIGTRTLEEVIAMSKRFAEDKTIQSMAKPAKRTTALNPAEWTDPEQKALEAALRKVPAGSCEDRWAAIANEVPGRSKDECVARFRYLKDLMTQKK